MERVIVSILIGISVFFMVYSFVVIDTLPILTNLNSTLILGIIFGIFISLVLYRALPSNYPKAKLLN